jgi:hypothetical protein
MARWPWQLWRALMRWVGPRGPEDHAERSGEMWTPFTLADLWNVDIAMILALLEKGTLKGTLVDGEWLINNADLDEYLQRKRGPHGQ